METWDEDTLLIQYNDLGLDPNRRLQVISAIGMLLDKPRGFYTPATLELLPEEWSHLQNFLEGGDGRQFWRLEPQGVQVIQPCEKHILVGTSQLFADLRYVVRKLPSRQSGLNRIWRTAQHYVKMEITRDGD